MERKVLKNLNDEMERVHEGSDHDSCDHLALPISEKDRTNRPVTHLPTLIRSHNVDTQSCGVRWKNHYSFSPVVLFVFSFFYILCIIYYLSRFPSFSLFALASSLFSSKKSLELEQNELVFSGGLWIPARWHQNRQLVNRKGGHRPRGFRVCRRERAIRSRQSSGHQP